MYKIKNSRQGFTLLELLVVVLIIGILTAIALPQYQIAVGKARFSTLKNLTKSLQQSAQRYYMMNNSYSNLNSIEGRKNLDIEIPKDADCWIYSSVSQIMCCKEIFKTKMCFYVDKNGLPLYCATTSTDRNDTTNRICQKEINRTPFEEYCSDACWYPY